MSPSPLLGPPAAAKDIQPPKTPSNQSDGSHGSQPQYDNLPMGYTENRSPTFLSSGNPCLDFFFHVVPNTPPESLTQRLQLAWDHNPLTTLKLVCNLRGVRGTGKSDKEGFYVAAIWLHQNHPKTLACNLDSLADFGYFKDLPEILFRLLEGTEVRKNLKQEWERKKEEKRYGYWRRGMETQRKKTEPKLNAKERARIEKEQARASRKEKKINMAKKIIARYSNDPEFRFLHERVSDLFTAFLKADMESLTSGQVRKIGLASKWCPSIGSSFDKSTLICESIARKMFPKENNPEYESIEEAHYVYRVRDRLRKEVLVPLRKVLELPEVYMCSNKWDLIPYNRVASLAMKFHKAKFLKHDKERFSKYLEDVKAGKTTIAAGALLPHEIIAMLKDSSDGGEVAELQWKRMVGDLMKKGKLRNCMAICDVSGSMSGTPMEVSVAMGVLVSELSDEPWKGKLITFSANPELQMVKGDDLKSKTNFVRRMNWGMNTDFQKVFDLILKVAVEGKLKPEQMIKRLFVFSDMEFDQASTSSRWETDYQVIVRKFKANGYGESIPQIVFWNLRDSRATPVPGNQNGVALVSGFSKNLIKIFLDHDGDINPEAVMEAAIAGEEYQKLIVFD